VETPDTTKIQVMLMQRKKENDLERLKLKGNIKQIEQYEIEAFAKFGDITKGIGTGEIYENSIKIFNVNGNEIKQNYYNPDGSLSSIWNYKYDDNGNQIEVKHYSSDGSLYIKWTYKYDDKGNQIEANQYYTRKGIRVKVECTYKYTGKGNKIKWCNVYHENDLFCKTMEKYNDKGNIVEEKSYYSAGYLSSKDTWKYDDKGNLIEKNRRYRSDDSNKSTDEWVYDTKLTYKYEYDNQGNWVKKIGYRDTIPSYIIEREIEYYLPARH